MSTLRLLAEDQKKGKFSNLLGGGWRVFTRAYWLEAADNSQIEKRRHSQNQRQVDNIAITFFIIAIAAKLAKVDGPLSKAEIDGFREAFKLPAVHEGESVEELFREALKDQMDATHYAKRIASFHPAQKEMLEELIDALFKFAGLDGPLNTKEILFLKNIVLALGFNEEEFRRILRCHTLPYYRTPYEALGIERANLTAQTLKTAYRKAVRHYHPDSFVGKDVPDDILNIAKENFRILTDAYEAVRLKHRFR